MIKFFDKLEDVVRMKLSRHPLIYAMTGGVAIVFFWRGVWHAADAMNISWELSLVISVITLLATGLFVSFFVGENIILTGLKHEKKLVEKAETEIKTEHDDITELRVLMGDLKRDLEEIKIALAKK